MTESARTTVSREKEGKGEKGVRREEKERRRRTKRQHGNRVRPARERGLRAMAEIKRNCRAGGSFCLSHHINTELIKTAELIEFL